MGHWLRRIWYLLNRRRLQRELDREMASHRAMMADQRHFGSTIRLREQSADVWGWTWLDALCQDIRFGARLLVKDRRLTLAAVAALALGLGATTTAFTFVNGALRDIPLADPDRLVWIRTVDARGRQLGVSYADVRDWREAARTLSHVIVSLELPMNVAESGLSPQRYSGSYISFNAFSMVGRVPVLGRGFRPDDDRADAPRVAIIAHTVWQNRYGGDPSVIGRTVRVSEVPATIIGVMPEGFHFPLSSEVWVPAAHVSGPPGTVDARRGNRGVLIFAFGRLADGIRLPQAQADMDAITSRLARDYPATNEGISVALEPIENLYWGGEWAIRQILLVVMAAVSFVLIIACVNVANLLLARAIHRSREMAVRSSLGATRGRIVRQLFVESVLLAAVAGALGFLVSLYGVKAFGEAFARMWALDGPPLFWMRFSMDGRVYTFLAAVCLGASILFGLAPALQISNASSDALKDGGRGASGGLRARRWTGALMVSQLALTLVLLAGTGLMLRSFLVVYQAGRALDTSNMITMRCPWTGSGDRQPAFRVNVLSQRRRHRSEDPAGQCSRTQRTTALVHDRRGCADCPPSGLQRESRACCLCRPARRAGAPPVRLNHRPRGGRPRLDCLDAAQGGPDRGSRPPGILRSHDGRSIGALAVATEPARCRVRAPGRDRAAARLGRPVRRHGAQRDTAHAGDRDSYGARRPHTPGGVALCEAHPLALDDRSVCGPRRRDCGRSVARTISRADRANRPAHLEPRHRAADRGGSGCKCLAGASRVAGRSRRGVAI
jgi:hypothetical protein